MLAALLLTLPVASPVVGPLPGNGVADDGWPGWRGHDGNGIAAGQPPVEWGEGKNIRWKVEISGKGNSSPIVFGDRVYVTTAVPTGKEKPKDDFEEDGAAAPDEQGEQGEQGAQSERGGRGRGGRGRAPAPIIEQEFLVLALDRKNGAVIWEKTAGKAMPHEGTHPDGTFASPTLVTDGKVLIASFGSYGLYAYDMQGELLWNKDLGDMRIRRSFGEGSSPVLAGDKLIVNWDNEDESFIVALNSKTGEEIWRKKREMGTTWVTPMVVKGKGGDQVVVATAKTVAYALDSGKEVWSYAREQATGGRGGGRGGRGGGDQPGAGGGVVTSPVLHEGILLYASGSRGGAFHAIRVAEATGELKDSEAVLWEAEGDTPFIPSPIAFDGILYSLKQNSGLLSAYDIESGGRMYGPERMSGLANAYASPVIGGEFLYFVGRDGTCEVVLVGPNFESVSVNTLDDDFDASPAIAGDELYLRGMKHVYCIAED